MWYEAAYIDIAQIGASCQRTNSTYHSDSGAIIQTFKVDYGKIPFSLKEDYNPTNNISGLYKKTAEEPGGKYLILPTVFVDATLSQDGSGYDTLTQYTCRDVLGESVTEIRFSTRLKDVPDTVLAQMESKARMLGVVWDDKKLKRPNYADCKF